jgi:glycerophosphoryl diester phosphodiesterase
MPRVIAHRGASWRCPENTLSAFDEGLAEGADGIELDLQLTRDGVPVVFHDDRLDKLGRPAARIADLSLAELAALDAGAWFDSAFAGEPVPTLGQVLSRYGGRTELCLEIKPEGGRAAAARDAELLRQTLGLVQASGAAARCYLLCFDAGVLVQAHALAPQLRTVLNAQSPSGALAEIPGLPGLFAVDVDVRRLKAGDGDRLRSGGSHLMSYTCDSEEELLRCLAEGVEYVITNRPARSRDFLARQLRPG